MKTFYSQAAGSDPDSVDYLFKNTYGLQVVSDPARADIIIWNGGADISPAIYGASSIAGSGPSQPSERDRVEIRLFEAYKNDASKLLLGVCRGAQLLNCLNGGQLYQHVNNHGRDHQMFDLDTGETLRVTSTHHQQMIPNLETGHLIGVSSESTAKYTDQFRLEFKPTSSVKHGEDAEIVWYRNTRSLCIQGHPEYVPGSRFSDYTWELLEKCKAA